MVTREAEAAAGRPGRDGAGSAGWQTPPAPRNGDKSPKRGLGGRLSLLPPGRNLAA